MFILRLLRLVFLFIRYNCFFTLGLVKGFPFNLFYGLYKPNSQKQAKRLVIFLEKSGSLFIKLGQILATRVDIFSEIYIDELKKLRSTVKLTNNKAIKNKIFKEFSGNFYNIFASIDETPIGVASIAAVYKATLVSGEVVVIKVLKPKIVKEINQDLAILKVIFKIIEVVTNYGKISKPTKVMKSLEKSIKMELDLRFEAAAANEIRDYFKEDIDIYIPKIYWQYTTKNVLVEEYVEAIKIGEVENLKSQGINLEETAKKITRLFFMQALQYGCFHGDIHSGNIMVLNSGKIVFIDFGIIGRLSEESCFYIKDLFLAFLNQDYKKAAQIHFDNGWISKKYSVDDFALACRAIMEKNVDLAAKDIMIGSLIEQLFTISQMFEMEVQEDLLILQKNLIYLESLGRALVPNKNMWMLSKEVIKDISSDTFSLQKEVQYKVKGIFKEVKATVNEIISENSKQNQVSYIKFFIIIIIILLFLLFK